MLSQHPEITKYTPISRWLHTTNATLILKLVIPVGVWIHFFEPNDESLKTRLNNIHESFGLVIFVVTLARLVWRWVNPSPIWPPNTPRWIRLASVFTHSGLYLLLLLMPVTGFLASNAWDFPLVMFDWIPISSPIQKNEITAKAFSFYHWFGALSMSALICVHLLGFTYHRLITKDPFSSRML